MRRNNDDRNNAVNGDGLDDCLDKGLWDEG